MPTLPKAPLGRRHCIPIIYTRGTHYEVGYDVGRTFGSLFHSYLSIASILNEEFIPAYKTPAGRKAYDETLAAVKKRFPQYLDELQGMADGAEVPFYKLFLLHMDNVITNVTTIKTVNGGASGCSSICINQYNEELLGHTEDARSELLNHFYFVSAHIISKKPQGHWGVKEERFTSLCYAGFLPGYTMSYNHHGLIFSINTLSATRLNVGKTPRYFITRALLAAENFDQAVKVLRDSGSGAADGCSINMTFLRQEGDRLFHNAELAPAEPGTDESVLNVLTASPGENIIHCNRYLRLSIPEADLDMLDSSEARMTALKAHKQPHDRKDIINMLSDQTGKKYRVFQDFGPGDTIKTLAAGIFDCVERTWSIYADKPSVTEPLMVLPIVLKENYVPSNN